MKPAYAFPRLAILAIISVFFAAPTLSFADTYQVVNLSSDQGYIFDGMSDSGLVVIYNPLQTFCGGNNGCFYSYVNGVSAGVSTTLPTFTADNGTPCTPSVPAGGTVGNGVCNNGRDAFTGELSSSQMLPGVYASPGITTVLSFGGGGTVYMNALGSIVFDNIYTQEFEEAVDLTAAPAPEPSTLLLLSTGMLAIAALTTLRRRPITASKNLNG
jgi:hypothetical protein